MSPKQNKKNDSRKDATKAEQTRLSAGTIARSGIGARSAPTRKPKKEQRSETRSAFVASLRDAIFSTPPREIFLFRRRRGVLVAAAAFAAEAFAQMIQIGVDHRRDVERQ